MARMIYVCKNKLCKAAHRVEYDQTEKLYRGYGRYEYQHFRVDATGRKIIMGYESTCLECGKQCNSARVKGVVSSHICDARCTSATGPNCECQCGGKNHGSDHNAAVAA